jgi:hypothetical protein
MDFLGVILIVLGIAILVNAFCAPYEFKDAKKKILKDANNLLKAEKRRNRADFNKLNDAILKAKIKNVIDEHVSKYNTETLLKYQEEFHDLIKTMVREFNK